MRRTILERSVDFLDVEVDLGDGVFADVSYTLGVTAGGEDPSESFDVDIELSGLRVIQVFDPDGNRIPITDTLIVAACRAFYKSRQSRVESILHDRIREGDDL